MAVSQHTANKVLHAQLHGCSHTRNREVSNEALNPALQVPDAVPAQTLNGFSLQEEGMDHPFCLRLPWHVGI